MSGDVRRQVGAVVGGVIRQALRDAGAAGLLVLEIDSPEGQLVAEWGAATLGSDRILGDTLLWDGEAVSDPVRLAELRRASARLVAARQGFLMAHPATKTVLLLSRSVPPEPLLPLGDLYASSVRDFTGACTLPPDVSAIADAAGSVEALDSALARWLEERRSLDEATRHLPAEGRRAVVERLRLNRHHRRWPRRVPKLGARTLWIDIFA